VSIQTSVLVLQRKAGDLIAVERAAGKINNYPVFMAVANHVGHDKRGNKIYVRDRKGNEVIEEIEELVKDWEDGIPIYQRQTTRRKVADDNTIQIAQEFRRWLSEQD
jgi:type I restriction enzyme M protein